MRRVLIIALLAIPRLVMADTTPVPVESTMDLALHINDLISVPLNAQLKVHIINMAPANLHRYDIHSEQYTVNPDPINTTGAFKTQPAEPTATTQSVERDVVKIHSTTDDVTKLMNILAAETDETKVPKEIADLTAALAGPVPSALVTKATAVIDSTKQDFVPKNTVLGADQGLILTIHRGSAGALPEQTWRGNFHVGGPGRFVSNYVFGFAPRGDEQFFSKATDPAGKFIITRSVRRDKVSYVPLVLFSWIPASKGNDAFVNGPAAGLGYDLSNLVVAASYLWTWHRNLGVTAGVMAQKQQRLKGTYHENDTVTTNLLPNDLTEAVWRPNIFVGVSIRSVSALFH